MLAVTHRSLVGTLKLRSVLQHRSEGHVWRREECFGPLSSHWSGDGGVRLTVIPSYLHSHRPLPKKHNTDPAQYRGWIRASARQPLLCHLLLVRQYGERHANPSVHRSTHQMSEGGKTGRTQSPCGAVRQMDERSDRQQSLPTKPTGKSIAYFRSTIIVLLHMSVF